LILDETNGMEGRCPPNRLQERARQRRFYDG
jgi:hypothetical protein